MDSEQHTNRKGFLRRTGLAIAGVFALSSSSRLSAAEQRSAVGKTESEFSRIRPAKGTVQRKA